MDHQQPLPGATGSNGFAATRTMRRVSKFQAPGRAESSSGQEVFLNHSGKESFRLGKKCNQICRVMICVTMNQWLSQPFWHCIWVYLWSHGVHQHRECVQRVGWLRRASWPLAGGRTSAAHPSGAGHHHMYQEQYSPNPFACSYEFWQ